MRVAVFSDLYPPVFLGGYEIGASQIVSEMERRGHEVLVLSAHEYLLVEADGTLKKVGHARVDRDRIVDVGTCLFGLLAVVARRHPAVLAREAARTLRARAGYLSSLRRFRPEAILVFNPLGVVAPVLRDLAGFSRRSGVPVSAYVSDHWVAAWPRGHPVLAALAGLRQSRRPSVVLAGRVLDRILKRAAPGHELPPHLDRYMYCSSFIRGISRSGSAPIARHDVVPWGLAAIDGAPPPSADRFQEEGPLTLAYAGQILEHKGLLVLLRALAACRREHRLVVVGDDRNPYAERCKRFAGSRGLAGRVEFVGKKTNAQTREIVRGRGHVLVVPSVWDEPFSIVVLEGMGMGLPVVASATGGTPEIVEDGRNGFLFPREDFRALRSIIDRLEGDRELCLRVGAEGRERVLAGFSMERMVDRVLEVLASPAGTA